MSSAPPSRRRGDDIQELLRAVATSDTSDDDDDDKGVVPHTKISSTAAQPVNVGQPLARSTDGGNRGAVANTTTNAKNYLAVSEFSSDSDDGGSNVASHQRRSASAATVRGASLASTALPPATTTAGSSTSSIPAAAAAASRRRRHMHNNGALSHVSSDDDDEHTAAPIRSTSMGAESAAAPNSGAGAASGGGSRHGGGFRLGSGVHTVSASRRQELHALQLSDDSDDNDDGNDPTMIVHGTAGSSSKAAQSHNTTLNTTVDPTPTPTYLHRGEAVAVADLRGEALVAAIEDANARYRTKRGSGGGRQTTISTVEVFETSTTSVVSRGAKSTTQEIASTTTTTVARAVASHGDGTSGNRSVVHRARDEDDRSAVTDEILNVSAVGGGGASAAVSSAASTAAPTDHNETAPPPVGGSGPMPPQQQRASTPTQHHSRSSSKMMANSDDDLFRADDLRIQPYQPKDEGVDEAQYAGRGGAVVGVGSGDAVKTDEVNIALTATSSTAMSPSPRDEFPQMYADASSRGGVERVGGATRQPTAGNGGAPSSSGAAAVVGQQRTTLQRNDDSSLSFVQDDEDSLLNVSGIPPSHISTAAANRGAVTGAKKSISPSPSVTGRQRQPLLSLSTAAITKKSRQERSGNHSALREGSALSEGRADTTVNSIQFELDGSLAHHPRGSHFDPMQEDRTSLVFSPAPDLASSSLVFTTGTSPNDGSLPTSPGQRRGGRGRSGTGATSAGGRKISPPPEADLNNPQPHATHKGSRPSSTTTTLKANGASSKVSAPLPPPPPRPQYVPQHQQRSSSSSSALRVMYDQAVRKRMYTNAKHEQLRAASAHVEMKECTFAPKITVKGSRAVSSAQQQQRPPNSARLVSGAASVGDVNDEGVGGADRPHNDYHNTSAQRRQRLLHEARGVERDGDLAECTFAPKVEPISAALVQRAREQAQAANTPLPTTTERLHLDSKRRAVELAHNTEISLKELRGSRPATKRSEDAIMSHVESLQRFQQRREETIQRLTQEEEQRHQRPSTQVKSNELLVDPDAVVHRLLHRAPSSSRGTADESNASAATMTAPQVNAVSRELALRRRETMLSEWFTALSGGVPMQTRGVDIAELDLVALFTVAQQPPLLGLGTSHAESPGRNTSVSPSRSASAPVSEVSSLTTSGSHQALARSLSTLRRTDEFHSIVAALLDYQRTRPATAPLPTSSSVNHNNEIVGGGGGMSSWWLTFAQFRAILHRVEHRGGPQLWSRRGPQQAIAHYREQQEQLNPTSRSATTEMRGDKEDEARIFQRLFSHQTCATWQKHKGIAGGNSAAAASYAILDKENQLHDHRTHGGDMEASGRRRMCSVAALEAHKAELSFAVAEEMNSSGYVEAWQPTKGERHDQTYAASPRDLEETKRHQSHALLKRRLEDNVGALDEEENESIDALLASLDAVVATRRHNKDMPSEVRPTYDGDHHHHHHRAPHDVDDPRGFQTPPPQTHDDDVSYVVLSPVPPPAAPPLAAAGQLDKIVAAASPSSSGSLAVVTVRGAPTTANNDKVVFVDGCEDLLLACAAANSSLVANSSSTQKKITTQRKLDLVEVTTTTTTTTTRRTGTANTATNVFYNTVKSTAATATTTTSGSAVVAVDMGGGNQQQHHAGGRIAASFISAREQRQAEEKRRLRELGKRLATVAVAGVR
ncbi:Hypothetical protein, putative [Bodo saltans]|uniref:Uncharacterized protein n=1 Tax=Bodo saltans TaxID=75058 RepID=A0A0S4IUL6_BODSA|nr:Hypothetical protein, putative [Bodo saltans]|eukprot:CUF98333.1 Hypothetical protein, putative [Bodo saltans]